MEGLPTPRDAGRIPRRVRIRAGGLYDEGRQASLKGLARLLAELAVADAARGGGRMNSRAKGKRGEREFIDRHLAAVWPDACRNLDQYGDDKRDVLRCAGIHWQIKRTERVDLWGA